MVEEAGGKMKLYLTLEKMISPGLYRSQAMKQ